MSACPRTGALLGEVIAGDYARLAQSGRVPPPHRVGVLLAGDLYASAAADRRGASGDVVCVWRAFADRFRWVAGVAGNHDRFGSAAERSALVSSPGVHLLDDEVVELDGLRIAGLGGIIGRAGRLLRRSPEDYDARLRRLVARSPDVVVLHESPAKSDAGLRGSAVVSSAVRGQPGVTVISGHCHWPQALAELDGTAVLNVDGRVALLTAMPSHRVSNGA